MRYQHIAHYLMSTVWAIYPPKLAAMMDALAFLAAGGEYSPAEIQAIVGAAPARRERVRSQVAVIPLVGVISHRADMMTEASGGTSIERFRSEFRAAIADPEIDGIVLEVDSPGGDVAGVDEMAAEIYEARKTKPIYAVADTMAASAAYWLASSASELMVTSSGMVGSIGVFHAHEDHSAEQEQLGVKTTLITAGKYKAEANPFGPLNEEAQAHMQELVDSHYDAFVRAVARNRREPLKAIREGYGEGRILSAKQALSLGMVDGIATLDETVTRMQARIGRKGSSGGNALALDELEQSQQPRTAEANASAKIEEPATAKVEEPVRRSIVQEREWLDLQRLR